MCCGKIGQNCCDNVRCYPPSTQKCCDDGLGTVCDRDLACCNGGCCPQGQLCCDGLECYNPATQKCCNDGTGRVCWNSEHCCPDGTCQDLGCCWQLEQHPDGSGTCACNWSTEHCGEFIEAWSISTCVRAHSGAEFCSIEYRQVGSKYACVETPDWIGIFLCYGGSYAVCTSLCAQMSLICSGSGFDPDTCVGALMLCQECFEDAGGKNMCNGCAMVDCDIGGVIKPKMDYAGTLSGDVCQ